MKNKKHKWGFLNLFLVPNVYMVNGSNRLMPMGIYDEATISKVSTEIAEDFNKKIWTMNLKQNVYSALIIMKSHILLLIKILFFYIVKI